MTKWLRKLTALLFVYCATLTHSANGQLLIPQSATLDGNAWALSAAVGTFNADYTLPDHFGVPEWDAYIKRSFVGGTIAYGVNPLFDLVAVGGYTFKSELEDFDQSGNGGLWGVGFRMVPLVAGASALHLSGQLLYFDEDYYSEPESEERAAMDISARGREIMLSAQYVFTMDVIKLFGGGAYIPYSDVKMHYKFSREDNLPWQNDRLTDDVERTDTFSLIAGGAIELDFLTLEFSALLVGETTFMFSLVRSF